MSDDKGASAPSRCTLRVPVQGNDEWGKEYGSVAWWEHVKAWEKGYGFDQTALRIAQRGGFSYAEIVYSLGHEPTTWEPGRIGWQYTPVEEPAAKTIAQNREANDRYAVNRARLRPKVDNGDSHA